MGLYIHDDNSAFLSRTLSSILAMASLFALPQFFSFFFFWPNFNDKNAFIGHFSRRDQCARRRRRSRGSESSPIRGRLLQARVHRLHAPVGREGQRRVVSVLEVQLF